MIRAGTRLGIVIFLILGTFTGMASAQGPSNDLVGRIVNGTLGAGNVERIEVSLHSFKSDKLIDTQTAISGSDGAFVFQNLPTDQIASYILTTTYEGVPYSSEVIVSLESLRGGEPFLTIYEPTKTLEDLAIASSSIFILEIDESNRAISVLELATIINKGDRTFIPDISQGANMAFLRFPLPGGAINLEVQTELPTGQVIQVNEGFGLTTPVPPGEHGVISTYTALYNESIFDFSRTMLMGSQRFRLLIAESSGAKVDSNLEDLGTTSLGGSEYRVFGSSLIAPAQKVSMILSGLPQPSFLQRSRESLNLNSITGLALVTVVTVVLMILLVVPLTIGRTKLSRTPIGEGSSKSAYTHVVTIDDIAELDNQYHESKIGKDEYVYLRQLLKSRLLQLTLNERS